MSVMNSQLHSLPVAGSSYTEQWVNQGNTNTINCTDTISHPREGASLLDSNAAWRRPNVFQFPDIKNLSLQSAVHATKSTVDGQKHQTSGFASRPLSPLEDEVFEASYAQPLAGKVFAVAVPQIANSERKENQQPPSGKTSAHGTTTSDDWQSLEASLDAFNNADDAQLAKMYSTYEDKGKCFVSGTTQNNAGAENADGTRQKYVPPPWPRSDPSVSLERIEDKRDSSDETELPQFNMASVGKKDSHAEKRLHGQVRLEELNKAKSTSVDGPKTYSTLQSLYFDHNVSNLSLFAEISVLKGHSKNVNKKHPLSELIQAERLIEKDKLKYPTGSSNMSSSMTQIASGSNADCSIGERFYSLLILIFYHIGMY